MYPLFVPRRGAARSFSLLVCILGTVAGIVCTARSAKADTVLDFQDIVIPGNTDANVSSYISSGFTITAPSGFAAHGSNSIFFAGSQALSAVAPASGSPNVIQLSQNNGQPFSALSIDLARNFTFDPAPTVTFTGNLFGGGTVTQSFTVTVPAGTAAFQTFTLTGFTNVTAVTWGQPVLAEGLHQFDNIRLVASASDAPEPSPLALLLPVIAAVGILARGRKE